MIKKNGFTLIELMVVIMVIAVLTGGAISAYLNFNTSQAVNNDTRNLIGALTEAKTKAATLQYPQGCVTLLGVEVASDQSNNGLKITTKCSSQNFTETDANLLISTVFTSPFDITFMPSSGYLQSGVDTSITISDQKNTPSSKTIVIHNYGFIDTQ